jgi:sec-independent protein translocase protein TatA
MGPVGVQEMIVIFLVALVLFGPKKLPELGRTVARAMQEFRKAQSELKATLHHHMSELERENESVKEITRSLSNSVYNTYYDSYNYDSNSYGSESHSNGHLALETSTAGASATQDAEAESSHAGAHAGEDTTANVAGTVPRTAESLTAGNGGESHPAAEPNPVNG